MKSFHVPASGLIFCMLVCGVLGFCFGVSYGTRRSPSLTTPAVESVSPQPASHEAAIREMQRQLDSHEKRLNIHSDMIDSIRVAH